MKRVALTFCVVLLAAAGAWLVLRSRGGTAAPMPTKPAATAAPAPPVPAPLPPPIQAAPAPPAPPSGPDVIRLPKGHAPERIAIPKGWSHPTTLTAALAKNPALANVMSKKPAEFPGMVDFKLGWLPRLSSCLEAGHFSYRGPIDVNLRFDVNEAEDMWIGKSAEIVGGELKDEEEAFIQCIAQTFVGVQRPILDPNHGDHYTFQTRVTIPMDQDFVYELIQRTQ